MTTQQRKRDRARRRSSRNTRSRERGLRYRRRQIERRRVAEAIDVLEDRIAASLYALKDVPDRAAAYAAPGYVPPRLYTNVLPEVTLSRHLGARLDEINTLFRDRFPLRAAARRRDLLREFPNIQYLLGHV